MILEGIFEIHIRDNFFFGSNKCYSDFIYKYERDFNFLVNFVLARLIFKGISSIKLKTISFLIRFTFIGISYHIHFWREL